MNLKLKKLTWLARISGGLAIVLVSVYLLKNYEAEFAQGFSRQVKSVQMIIGFSVLGYFFAWFREKEGGIMLVVAALIVGMTMYYQSTPPSFTNFSIYSIPLLIPGVLFWISGNKKQGAAPSPRQED